MRTVAWRFAASNAGGAPDPPLIAPRSMGVSPFRGAGGEPPPKRPGFGAWIVVILLLGALLAGGYFLVDAALRLLPGIVGEKKAPTPIEAPPDIAPVVPAPPPEVEAPAAPRVPAPDSALRRAERERAEALLLELLGRRQSLTERGAEIWGGAAFGDILRFSEAGDEALIGEDFLDAAENYRRALRQLDALESRLPQAFQEMLRDGNEALARGDGETARRSFDAARRIDPDHPQAQTGYRRAQTIEQVTALVMAGSQKEAVGRFSLALADFQEALRLDALSPEADAGVQRVSAEIRQTEFRDSMSQGLAALRAGDLDRAESLIRKARDIEPAASAVREAMQQVSEARQAQRIRDLDMAARAAETREDWTSVREYYAEVLEINPLIRSAQEGRDRAVERLHVLAEMALFVADPDQLTSPEGRARGLRAQAIGRRIGPAGPGWNERFAQFEALLERATAPVRVTLRSDGQTAIDVYRVGRFGRLTEREMEVPPGMYTVVGHRPGFRDTRLTLNIPVGSGPLEIEVICRDPIR